MTGRALDDFDEIVRHTLSDVATALRHDPDLADRLIANATTPGRRVVSLGAARRARPWMTPLLAAATVAALAIAGAAGADLLAESGPDTPGIGPSVVFSPSAESTPTPTATPTPTSTGSTTPVHAHSNPAAAAQPHTQSSARGQTGGPPPEPTAWPHFRANSITFADSEHGWVLGDGDCPHETPTTCAGLLATSDRGQSWQRLLMPADLGSTFNSASCDTNGTSTGPCVDHVLFTNDRVGYMWSRHDLYWTTDGGTTWSHYESPAWQGASRMVIAGNAVIRIVPAAGCSAGCAGVVQTAPLGTADFTGVTMPTDQVGLDSSTLAVHDGDVYLFAGGVGTQPGPGILRSSDGGATWQQVAAEPCGSDVSFDGALSVVADDGALIADCAGSSYRVAQPGSTDFADGGSYPTGHAPTIVAAGSADAIIAAEVTDRSPGSELPMLTTCYTTTDGGQTWQRGTTLRTSTAGAAFVSQSTGYAPAETGYFFLTHNGGITWSQQSFIR